MKQWLYILTPLLLASCGDNSSDATTTQFSSISSQITFDDVGNSNRVLTCNEASMQMQSANFALGMSNQQIRAIAGKPRHITPNGIIWRFGDDREPLPAVPPFGAPLYFVPTAEVPQFIVEAFSLDNSLCDDTEITFVQAANSLVDSGVQASFVDEIPSCFDAGVRIAARVEQGMNIDQVLELVGRPVEVTSGGTWRYGFASETEPNIFPKIYFNVDEFITPEDGEPLVDSGTSTFANVGVNYLVRGYSSAVGGCLNQF